MRLFFYQLWVHYYEGGASPLLWSTKELKVFSIKWDSVNVSVKSILTM